METNLSAKVSSVSSALNLADSDGQQDDRKIDLTPSDESTFDNLFETILIWAQNTFGEDELIRAREEFFWKAGKVFHDDHFYDQRVNYFLDYFLMQRPLSGIVSASEMHTPFEVYSQQKSINLPTPSAFKGFIHSVFQVLKVSEKKIICEDILAREKITIHARADEKLSAIRKKDVFQGFLYLLGGHIFLSRGIIFHPPKSSRQIRKRLKSFHNKDNSETLSELFRLARQNLKYLRHINVDPKKIYADVSL